MDDPIDAINRWQQWYRSNRVIAEIDASGISKDSRESLHGTAMKTELLPGFSDPLTGILSTTMDTNQFKTKATEYFADTIAEFFNELSGAELFECFLTAAHENAEQVRKEYEKARDLVNLLRCK